MKRRAVIELTDVLDPADICDMIEVCKPMGFNDLIVQMSEVTYDQIHHGLQDMVIELDEYMVPGKVFLAYRHIDVAGMH